MASQFIWGSVVLGLCSLLHLVFISWWIGILKSFTIKVSGTGRFQSVFVPIAGTFALLIFSHTVQVWIWAIILIRLGALPELFQAIYFSLITYTTVGYGDLILSDPFKIFGAMASVTGLLNFGVSTAVLVAVLGSALPNHLGSGKP